MDFATNAPTLDTANPLALAVVVVGGYALLWSINKVIGIIKK